MDYPFASRDEGPGFNPQGGYLCETGICLLALSCCIGDPNVIWSLTLLPFSGCFTRLCANNVKSQQLCCASVGASLGSAPTMWLADVILLYTALLSWFHARCRSSFWLHNQQSRLLGGALWRTCNLEPAISLLSHYVSLVQFASRHEGKQRVDPLDQWDCVWMQWDCRHSTGLPPCSRLCRLWSRKADLQQAWNRDRGAVRGQVGLSHCQHNSLVTVRDEARLRRGHNNQSRQGHQCSETTLTGESRFHILTPLGIEPGSLMTGSKRVVHWTSETWCKCSEIAGSPQYLY